MLTTDYIQKYSRPAKLLDAGQLQHRHPDWIHFRHIPRILNGSLCNVCAANIVHGTVRFHAQHSAAFAAQRTIRGG